MLPGFPISHTPACPACLVPKLKSLTEQPGFLLPAGTASERHGRAPLLLRGGGEELPGGSSYHPAGEERESPHGVLHSFLVVAALALCSHCPPWFQPPRASVVQPPGLRTKTSTPNPQIHAHISARVNSPKHTLLLSLIPMKAPGPRPDFSPKNRPPRSLPPLAASPCFPPQALEPSPGAGSQALTVLCPFLAGASLHPCLLYCNSPQSLRPNFLEDSTPASTLEILQYDNLYFIFDT